MKLDTEAVMPSLKEAFFISLLFPLSFFPGLYEIMNAERERERFYSFVRFSAFILLALLHQ